MGPGFSVEQSVDHARVLAASQPTPVASRQPSATFVASSRHSSVAPPVVSPRGSVARSVSGHAVSPRAGSLQPESTSPAVARSSENPSSAFPVTREGSVGRGGGTGPPLSFASLGAETPARAGRASSMSVTTPVSPAGETIVTAKLKGKAKEVTDVDEDEAEEESGDEPVEAAPKPRATRGARAIKAKGSAVTPSKANVRGAEAVQEPEVEAKVEVKVEIVRNVPPCTKCAAKNVVCEGQPGMACLGCAKGHVGCSLRGGG